jgi:hypothetical protein
MAVFVELDDDDVDLPQDVTNEWARNGELLKKVPPTAVRVMPTLHYDKREHDPDGHLDKAAPEPDRHGTYEAAPPPGRENPNHNRMTEALGCYPYADHHLHCCVSVFP